MAPFTGEPSYSQQVALAIVPKITSSLSIIGSSYIIFDCVRALKRKKDDRSTYRRLMIGLSGVDITMSICFFLSTWPMPRGTPFVFGARGSTQTCTAQGFFAQIGVSSVMYNASLSTYYLLVIRYGWLESHVVHVEPWLHAIPLVFGFATMIVGLFLKLYNYGVWDCWIAPYPLGCEESWQNGGKTTCERGDNASLYQILFDLVPKWASLFLVTLNMWLTYRAVRTQEGRTQRYSYHRNTGTASNQSLKMSRRLARQSYLYVGALYLTNLPLIITRVSQFIAGVTYYEMMLSLAILVPMQGFWNVLVYLRPRYLKARRSRRTTGRSTGALSNVTSTGGSTGPFWSALPKAVREGDIVESKDDEHESEITSSQDPSAPQTSQSLAAIEERTQDQLESGDKLSPKTNSK